MNTFDMNFGVRVTLPTSTSDKEAQTLHDLIKQSIEDSVEEAGDTLHIDITCDVS